MIISKTPLRMSFVGGGSDLPAFYERQPGAVITTTIDKYVYVTVNKKFDDHVRLSYSETENVENVDQIKYPIVKAVLKRLNIPGGIEITSIGDIPSKGTGLGSSSAFTVGLINALKVYQEQKFSSPHDLADQASEVEIKDLGEPIGKQDQYGVAFGGLKFLQFHSDGQVSVDHVICSRKVKEDLDNNILMLYTGLPRPSSSVLNQQKNNLESDQHKVNTMKKMVQLAHDLYQQLQKDNLDAFGEILHANWMYKKEMADNLSNPAIDEWYSVGRQHGALGGKILGAGAGGFLIFYAPQERHQEIKAALPHLKPVDFKFENNGSQIIFIH